MHHCLPAVLLSALHLAFHTVEAHSSGPVTRGEHFLSPHTAKITRRQLPRLRNRSQETRNIIDNEHMKYIVPITVGDQILNVLIDTGSSDTWLLHSHYECFHTYDNTTQAFVTLLNTSVCNFGPAYSPGAEFTLDPDIHQLTCYGAGVGTRRCAYGPFGYTNVTLNGFTAPHQLIGTVNEVIDPFFLPLLFSVKVMQADDLS